MELLIVLLLLADISIQVVCQLRYRRVYEELVSKVDNTPKEPAGLTDPFQRPRERFTSDESIIIPKSPQQIRNENFKKIKEGLKYGDFN